MSSALYTFVPSFNNSSSSTGNASRAELDSIRNSITEVSNKIQNSPVSSDVEELKKFTEFLKFRIDSLDTRMSAAEVANKDITSKVNIMEITISALSSVLKAKATLE